MSTISASSFRIPWCIVSRDYESKLQTNRPPSLEPLRIHGKLSRRQQTRRIGQGKTSLCTETWRRGGLHSTCRDGPNQRLIQSLSFDDKTLFERAKPTYACTSSLRKSRTLETASAGNAKPKHLYPHYRASYQNSISFVNQNMDLLMVETPGPQLLLKIREISHLSFKGYCWDARRNIYENQMHSFSLIVRSNHFGADDFSIHARNTRSMREHKGNSASSKLFVTLICSIVYLNWERLMISFCDRSALCSSFEQ